MAHGSGAEAAHNRLNWLNLLNRQCWAVHTQVEQITRLNWWTVVDHIGVGLIGRVPLATDARTMAIAIECVRALYGLVEGMDDRWTEGVILAILLILVEAGVGEGWCSDPECLGMTGTHITFDTCEADPPNPCRCPGEACINQRLLEAQRLKDLCATVAIE